MEWISVEDRIPKPYKDVLLLFSRNEMCAVGSLTDDGSFCSVNVGNGRNSSCAGKPDYWMPLPEPPKD